MRKLKKYLGNLLIILLMPAIIYTLLVIAGGAIPVNANFESRGGIKIYLVQNGSHTDIVVPASNEVINWKNIIKPEHFPQPLANPKFYSFGWGDREFYRTTPYWEDLTFKTAFNALFLNTPSAMHIKQIDNIDSERLIEIDIDKGQYIKLSKFFLMHLDFQKEKTLTPLDFHYSDNDVFYASRSSFHAFRTCNSWINSALKYSGLRSCLWTPFAFPLFWHNS